MINIGCEANLREKDARLSSLAMKATMKVWYKTWYGKRLDIDIENKVVDRAALKMLNRVLDAAQADPAFHSATLSTFH